MKTAPDPKDIQEFQFKQSSIYQIWSAFAAAPLAYSLLAADKKRGLLYVIRENKIVVLKPGEDSDPEWRIELELPLAVFKIALSCDCSYLAVAPHRPSVLIYDAHALANNSLQLLHEIRISVASTDAFLNDLKWNPGTPSMLCTVASDYTVGCFQLKKEAEKTIDLKALEKLENLDVLCAAWSPKGKQIVVGCKNGNIVQLKPDLKVARTIVGPSPYIGEVITILWISNYQFCAAYLGIEQDMNVLIVDAPKGEANAVFTCYEDITYGIPEGEGSVPGYYYFDHVPEWGIIIAASSCSSEIALLGSTDGGATWSQWQLIDSGRAQLPLICTTESYPVGLVVDKSPVRKLPWGESTLPIPVPILHILGTSGQLCSFHMINLTPNCPAINTPPTEIVGTPPQSRPSITPSEASILINAATSTPRPKQQENSAQRPKQPAPIGNIFGDSLKVAGFFQQPSGATENSLPAKPEEQRIAVAGTLPSVEAKPTLVKDNPQVIAKAPRVIKTPSVVKETIPQVSVERKAALDESVCQRAYLIEQNLFEEQLRTKLEPQTWECGTEEERKQLVEKAAAIEHFPRKFREKNTASSNIVYLKALLLQSFAWVEEAKSKNSATIDTSNRRCGVSNKISDLQKLYYYTQTQLTQAIKMLDLEWSNYKTQMRIPSLEFVYQSIILHNKILTEEKAKLKHLAERWKKSVTRTSSVQRLYSSMSGLRLTTTKSIPSVRGKTGVIEARCKTIATKTLSFAQNKQKRLKHLLENSSLTIIKPVNPSPMQERLEATLSSLACFNSASVDAKSKVEPVTMQAKDPAVKPVGEKAKQQSPLASLNSIVARIGASETNNTAIQGAKVQNKLLPVVGATAFPSSTVNKAPQAEKKLSTPTILAQAKPKQEANLSFGSNNPRTNNTVIHHLPNLTKAFPKVESISFGAQKPQESMQKLVSKEAGTIKEPKETEATKVEANLFSGNSLKDVLSSDYSSGRIQSTPLSALATTSATKSDSMASFSFATPLNVPTIVKSTMQDAILPSQATIPQTFSFASKPAGTSVTKALTESQGPPDLAGLTMGLDASNQRAVVESNQSSGNPTAEEAYYKPALSATEFDVSSFQKNALKEITISLVNGIALRDNNAATTAPGGSVIVDKIALKESNVFPASSAAPLFGSSTSILSIPMFGAASGQSSYATPTVVSSASTFGAPAATSAESSIFSGFNAAMSTASTIAPSSSSGGVPPFYSSMSKPTFGEAPTSGAPATLNFGNATVSSTTSMASVFGKSPLTSTLASNSQFPSTAATGAPPAFGKQIINAPSMPFGGGGQTNSLIFSNTPATSASTNIFGRVNSTSTMFGGNTPAVSSTGSIFGGNAMRTFGTPAPAASGSIFDGNAQKTNMMFSAAPNTGNSASFFATNSTNNASPAVVGGGSTTGGTASTFGTPPAGPASLSPQQPAFGQAPAFGAKPIFGSTPIFGQSKPIFGEGFGTTPFGANTSPPPAFGSPPPMGGNPPIENNMSKVFGSPAANTTFESLASQPGGLSFSSLAQKSPEVEKPPVFQGGSSFSSWR